MNNINSLPTNKDIISTTISTCFLVSIYKNELPYERREDAPEFPVCELVFVDRKKFCNLTASFYSIHFINQFCNKYHPLLRNIIFVISVNCILPYFVRLYIVSPTDSLR